MIQRVQALMGDGSKRKVVIGAGLALSLLAGVLTLAATRDGTDPTLETAEGEQVATGDTTRRLSSTSVQATETTEEETTTTDGEATTSTAAAGPPTTPPPTTPPLTFPPPPSDMADPDAPGIVYQYPDTDMADPAIFWDPSVGLYRLYTTNQIYHRPAPRIVNVPMWTSPNLRDWTMVGDVLPTLFTWSSGGYTWAPEVHQFGNRWVLYPTIAHSASRRHCIGYAFATTPAGPFEPDNSDPLICQLDRNGSIDAMVFTDRDGTKWMYWKSEENAPPALGPTHIWAQRLDHTGHLIGPAHIILSADQPWQNGMIESPSMVRNGDQYWMFISGGPGDTAGYSIAVVACQGPAGPCESATEERKIVRSNRQGAGPGEQGTFYDVHGNLWMAYSPNSPFQRGGIRPLALAHIKFGPFGVPYVATPPPTFWR